jgi:hypothetical protein
VALGHGLDDILDRYPALAVRGFLKAAETGRRRRLTEATIAVSVGVAAALDLAFNQGKGKVLEHWLKEVTEENAGPKTKRPKMSDRAFSFFTSLPRRSA